MLTFFEEGIFESKELRLILVLIVVEAGGAGVAGLAVKTVTGGVHRVARGAI